MSEKVKIAFERKVLLVALSDILPSKRLAPEVQETVKYKLIVASVAQLGLIEPLSVARQKDGSYLLLDGHVRFDALRQRLAEAGAKPLAMPVIMRGSLLRTGFRPLPATLDRHDIPSALQPRRRCQDDGKAGRIAIFNPFAPAEVA